MNFGFNTNVRVGGAVYHVQTEDRGPSRPFLDTVVYQAGRVVHKRSTCYKDLVASLAEGEDPAQVLRARLVEQHREVISALENGTLSLNAALELSTNRDKNSPRQSLQIRLLNPPLRVVADSAILEIELRQEGSVPPAGALIEALFENQEHGSDPASARTDAFGRATLQLPFSGAVEDGAILQIRARHGQLSGGIRFRLRLGEPESAAARPEINHD